MTQKRVQVILFVCALLMIFATTASADTTDTSNPLRYVRLTVDGEVSSFYTRAVTVGQFLEFEEISLNEKDILNLALYTELNLTAYTDLRLRRSIFIYVVIDGGEAFRYEVGPAQRVGHIIAELRERDGSDFIHNGFLNDVLTAESTLYLTSRITREHIMAVAQPYYREVRLTRGLEPGETRVLQAGVHGEITTVINTVYVGGVEVERTVGSVSQTRVPIPEIVIMGDEAVYPPVPLSPGTIMSVGGTVGNGYAYTLSKIMESTGYSAQQPELGNYTASGHRAVRGVIAVDPRVIPLGTWVYVENYGRALASDTGGAIRGYIIDLCFDTVAEAIQHGRRNVRIWILRDQFSL